ncbi:uncharacterized protein LOC135466035 isoform X6 [Liolophura sinensis]|uniref:uncharacterized protein LOC135466035 isoform X6 n=1 Tax=Liolophura sinensis TaxID=3198878 RepID=UPI003158903F
MDSWLVVASTTWMRTIHPQGPSDLPEPFSLGQTITWPMRCQVTPPNMSTDTVYDNMDLAAKSRGKDKRLMSQVNAALAYATPSTPARARANRRADRQQQQQPVSSSTYNTAYRVPYQDIDYTPAYNPDRYDRFNLRTRQRAARVYTPGSLASKATYRLDSYVDPIDVFYTPATVYKMRERVRDAQEKLDLHRQMLDRYLEVDLGPGDDVAARIARKQKDLEARQPEIEKYTCDIQPVKLLIPKEPPFRIFIPKDSGGKGGPGGGSGGQTSALRQRLRKVLCKSHNDPTYYKD